MGGLIDRWMIMNRLLFSSDSHWLIAPVCAALLSCAPGSPPSSNGSMDPQVVTIDPQHDRRQPDDTPDPAPVASASTTTEDVRPPSRPQRQPRSLELIETELHGLDALLNATPTNAPDHVDLLRRLAEDFAEAEIVASAEGKATAATNARTQAIRTYSSLISDHPTYRKIDEVFFYLAVEYEHAKDVTNARKNYFALISKAPQSPFVPRAYLAFGELFFDEGANDPTKFSLAASAYREVVKYPPPKNEAYGYAWYKLGWVSRLQGDHDEAVKAFNKAIEFATSYPSVPGSPQLEKAARADIVSLGP
jgi:TolA-binding protein